MPGLLLALVALLLVLPASAPAAVVGIADQTADSFHDARLRALGLRNARLVVPYDAAATEPDRVQAWLDAVAAAGMQPHVAFEHVRGSGCPSFRCVAPSRAQYAAAVRRFRARFPQVTTFTTWNEANHQSQPVSGRPELVAGYYEELRAACDGCAIVAGDVLDSGGYVRWLERFRAATSTEPRLWGLHNYGDATYGRTTGADAVLAAVPGELWLEETGGIVTLRNAAGRVTLSTDEARAARAVDHAFALTGARPRIGRLYVYHWKARAFDRFDAGLARPDGSLRPSYAAVRRGLGGPTPVAAKPTPQVGWRASWSRGRLALRATCRAPDGRCRGRVTMTLRLRVRGRWVAKRLTNRAYRTFASRRTTTLRAVVPKALRRRARRATRRTLALRVGASAPTTVRASASLPLRRPA